MKHKQSNDSTSFDQLVSIIREADRAIEKWIFHFIDQIDNESGNQTNQQNE